MGGWILAFSVTWHTFLDWFLGGLLTLKYITEFFLKKLVVIQLSHLVILILVMTVTMRRVKVGLGLALLLDGCAKYLTFVTCSLS